DARRAVGAGVFDVGDGHAVDHGVDGPAGALPQQDAVLAVGPLGAAAGDRAAEHGQVDVAAPGRGAGAGDHVDGVLVPIVEDDVGQRQVDGVAGRRGDRQALAGLHAAERTHIGDVGVADLARGVVPEDPGVA